MTMKSAVTAGLLAVALLSGCSRSEPEEAAPTENAVVEDVAPVTEAAPPAPEPAPVEAPPAVVNTVAPPPAAPVAPDEQMLDDADATGMTARANRDEARAEPGADDAAAPEVEPN